MATRTTRYDPLDPAVLADPFDTYRELRDHDPVHRHASSNGPSFVVLSRFADIWDAVRQPASFSSAQGLTFWPDEIARLGLAPTIVMLDPPRHTELRRLISRGWTQRRVAELEDTVRTFVQQRLDAMGARAADGEDVDLQRELASPIPTFVLSTLLAVPTEHAARFDAWTRALVQLQEGGPSSFEDATTSDPAAAEGVAAVAEMFGVFQELITARRADAGDDLLSALVHAEIDGEHLTDWDILGFCFVIVAGGNDTTANLISHTVMLLDGDHAQRDAVVADPELIPNALLEGLRLESSVQGLCRTTMHPVTMHDTVIPEGTKVLMLYGSGNRDEREFGPTAEQLDIRRPIPRHLGFSSGNHFCVGSHLALLQARVALEELLARHPHVGVDVAGGERVLSSFTRGWSSLPATGLSPPRTPITHPGALR
jgi:cytochrome P450